MTLDHFVWVQILVPQSVEENLQGQCFGGFLMRKMTG